MNKIDFNKLIYASEKHRISFYECCNIHLDTGRELDAEVVSVLYLIALAESVQGTIRHSAYDFEERLIKPECLKEPWQTSGTLKALGLAFNLWNGFAEEDKSTPYEIFDNHWAPYFVQAIKLRFKSSFEPWPNFFKTVYGTSCGR